MNKAAVGYLEKPYIVIKANSGAIRFSITNRSDTRQIFSFHLLKNDCPHKIAYTFYLDNRSILHIRNTNTSRSFDVPHFQNQAIHDFWLTWFNGVICLGDNDGTTFVTYSDENAHSGKELIGFIRFDVCVNHNEQIQWDLQTSPITYIPTGVSKKVDGGALRWVTMDRDSPLPIDALIGGMEDEPLYVARAEHRGSLCLGKYIKSRQLAFILGDEVEIPKDKFEVLCGYDGTWVKCSGNHIPENAFIGGYSEVRQEPFFIGRDWVNNNLVIGKVLNKTCYIPCYGKEVKSFEYETLVIANRACRGETSVSRCYMRMVNQPCL